MQATLSRLVLISFLFCGAGLAAWVATHYRFGRAEVKPASLPSRPLSIRGLEVSSYLADKLRSKARADHLAVKARKLSVFRIKSVNEAVLANAYFEVHEYAAGEAPAPEASFGAQISTGIKGLADLKGAGRVTRAVFDGLKTMTYKDGSLRLCVEARLAEMDIQRSEIQMQDVVIENFKAGRSLVSKRAIWDAKADVFILPEEYNLKTSAGTYRGRNIAMNLDLQILGESKTLRSRRPSPGGVLGQAN